MPLLWITLAAPVGLLVLMLAMERVEHRLVDERSEPERQQGA